MGLEGELRIGLRVRDARIERIGVTSTRPDIARSLLQGRSRAEVVAAVPRLFSICGQSQVAVSALACAAAAGEARLDEQRSNGAAAVGAEIVREYAWRTLLEHPQAIGETPADDAVAAARASLAFRGLAADASHEGDGDGADVIAVAAFGMTADEWLMLCTLPEFDRWADAGTTATARFVRRLRDDDATDAARGDGAPADPAWLDTRDHAEWLGELAAACSNDADFARLPTWRGAPLETGALARLLGDPLVAALLCRSASRVPARFVARLRELALLLADRTTPAIGALSLPSGDAIAWVENARGLLLHQVRLEQDRVRAYRIVAPTEWNFHPGGALASALLGTPADDLAAVRRRAARLVNSLDPCVACHVEFDDA